MQARQGLVAVLVAACAMWLAASASAASAPSYQLKRIAHLTDPTYVAQPPKPAAKGRLFVVTRAGLIRVIQHGKVLKTPFLDIRKDVMTGYQRGMFSIAFAPDYSRSGLFYVEYVLGPDDTVQLDEFRRMAGHPDRADPTSQRHVLNVGHAGPFHHGGQVVFGPDGHLYMSTGVDDNGALAQRLDDLHGKILRIDPRASGGKPYTVPADNPFVGQPPARPEVWQYGLRNPWRFSFDRRTGDLAIGDVGENSYEEVDFVKAGTPAGRNFGYPIYEGNYHIQSTRPTPANYTPPVLAYRHNLSPGEPTCAVMGGYVVRDRKLYGLYGRYLFADMCTAPLRSAILQTPQATDVNELPNVFQPGMMSFSQDSDGHLYVMTLDGNVDRIKAIPPTLRYRRPHGRRKYSRD